MYGEFKNFIGIANGSANELMTQLILSQRLKVVSQNSISKIVDDLVEIQKMSYALIKKFY